MAFPTSVNSQITDAVTSAHPDHHQGVLELVSHLIDALNQAEANHNMPKHIQERIVKEILECFDGV